jgi:hypothetical protein
MADPVAGQSALTTDAPASPETPAPAATADLLSGTAPLPSSSWFEGLPEGLKANPTLQNFKGKDVSAVAESLVNAEKLIGGSLRLPTEKDTPADRAAKMEKVYAQLGRPATPDAYNIPAPAADSGVPWDTAKAEAFKGVAHKLGLTQEQVQGLTEYEVQRSLSNSVDQVAAFNTCMETLDKDWGAATKQMLGLSRRTAATYFDADTIAALDASGVSNDPRFVKALAKMGKDLLEEGLIVGGREGLSEDGGVMSMQAEVDKVMGDVNGPYWNKAHPGHDSAVTRMAQLRQAVLELTTAR